VTAPTADRELDVDDLRRQQARARNDPSTPPAGATTGRTYNLGAVRPFVKRAAEEIGNRFAITTIGGWRASAVDVMGHPAGLAIDVMCSGGTLDAVRQYAVANRSRLGVKYVLAKQREYSQEAGWDTGRPMEDRGSPTDNHMDHAHINFKLMGGSGGDLIDGGSTPDDTPGMGDRVDSILPDWMGGANQLLVKGLALGCAAGLLVLGAKQAVTKGA
jgi:hypothetical protein